MDDFMHGKHIPMGDNDECHTQRQTRFFVYSALIDEREGMTIMTIRLATMNWCERERERPSTTGK